MAEAENTINCNSETGKAILSETTKENAEFSATNQSETGKYLTDSLLVEEGG